jgi:hypothetical protein
MRSTLNKGQFYVLTAVVIVGFFFLLSRYVSPYSFIDTSTAITDDEIFFFNNMRNKAEKTVQESESNELVNNLNNFTELSEKAGEKAEHIFVITYTLDSTDVNFDMSLITDKYTLNSSFSVPRP